MEKFRSVVKEYSENHPQSVMQQEIVNALKDVGHALPNNLPLLYLFSKPIDKISENTEEMETLRQWYNEFDQQPHVFKLHFSRALGKYIRSRYSTNNKLLLQDFRADPVAEAFYQLPYAQIFPAFMKLIFGDTAE